MTIKHFILFPFLVASIFVYAQTGKNNSDSGYTISVSMPYVGQGETFRFGLSGTQLTATITKSNTSVTFPGKFTAGTAYSVNQLDGPRSVQVLTANRSGTIADADVEVIADGGGAPHAPVFIQGFLKAPAGTQVVIRNNGKDPVTVTAIQDAKATWSTTPFKFKIAVKDTSHCNITAEGPAGMTTMVINGNDIGGKNIPARWNRIVVTCEYNFDQTTRGKKPTEASTYYETSAPVIAGSLAEEGRYVAFVSNAAGFTGSTGKHRQIFLRDRTTGETTLISKSASGEEGNDDSFAPTMNINGELLAFESHATNLVEGDKNGHRDIFVWNNTTKALTRITVTADGTESNGESYEPSLSNDGGEIAFTSLASNLTPGVPDNYTTNVFVYNFYEKKFILVTADLKTGKAVGGSKPYHGNIKHRVVFCSNASSLVPDDHNNLWDIFLYEPGQPMKRMSVPANGIERNQGTESASRLVYPSISGDGEWVTFATTATNMVPDDNNNMQDAFEVEAATGKVFRISLNSKGQEANGNCPTGQEERIAINFDGKWTAYSSHATNFGVPEDNIMLHNLVTGESRAITNIKGGSVGQPVLSIKANYVLFGTGEKLDKKIYSSGLFAAYTGLTGSRFNYQSWLTN